MAEIVEVQLGLLESQPPLPKVIKIPVVIMKETGLSRNVTLKTRDQVVPKVLRDWMLTHRDYKRWFAEGEEVVVVVDAQGVAVVDDKPPTEDDLDLVVDDKSPEDDPDPVVEETTPPPTPPQSSGEGSEIDVVAPWDEDFSDDTSPAIDLMTIKELKAFAKEQAIDIGGLTLIAEIRDAIYDALNAD